MFISSDKSKLREAMVKEVIELDYQIDYLGVHTLISE